MSPNESYLVVEIDLSFNEMMVFWGKFLQQDAKERDRDPVEFSNIVELDRGKLKIWTPDPYGLLDRLIAFCHNSADRRYVINPGSVVKTSTEDRAAA